MNPNPEGFPEDFRDAAPQPAPPAGMGDEPVEEKAAEPVEQKAAEPGEDKFEDAERRYNEIQDLLNKGGFGEIRQYNNELVEEVENIIQILKATIKENFEKDDDIIKKFEELDILEDKLVQAVEKGNKNDMRKWTKQILEITKRLIHEDHVDRAPDDEGDAEARQQHSQQFQDKELYDVLAKHEGFLGNIVSVLKAKVEELSPSTDISNKLLFFDIFIHDINPFFKTFNSANKTELDLDDDFGVELEDDSDELETLASYDMEDNKVKVLSKNRALPDIIRSIAHELVHHKQNQGGELTGDKEEGEDGAPLENEANAKAGEIVRKFGKIYPADIYET